MSQNAIHTGAIKAIQFNPLKPQILATAGAKGELYIHDVNDMSNSTRLGNTAARSDDIECLAWNRKVSHILATGGSGGFVTVWDLKTKKASLTLNNSRKPVSALAWDPNNSTKLLTATPDDNTPVILLWDLRNSNAPEKTLQGHEQGVLSLSWCSQDSELLLSSGKDNKTIVWNPKTGEKYGELPEVMNWTFQTRFNPHNPNLSATASFDGKITIQTLQNTNPDNSKAEADKSLDDEDFFRAAQTQPQGASWTLNRAPQWLERPIGASFGFGGKVVIFKANPAQAGQPRSSKIAITTFSVDSDVSSATERFQEAIAGGNIAAICEERAQQAKTEEEKADWKVMETLAGDDARGKIVQYLGLKDDELTNGEPKDDDEKTPEPSVAKSDEEKKKQNRLSSFFKEGDGEADGEEDFLKNLSATKGAKTDNPFQLFSDSDTAVEKSVTKALMLGDFGKATDICLKEDRMADAFLIANCGGQELVDKVQAAYLSRKSGVPSYMRLLGSVIAKNLWDVVYNADLANWKETMVILCTFSDPSEFPDLCEALGDRILDQGERKDASFCYLVGSKLEKVVSIWVTELEEAEEAGMKEPSEDSTFSVHARSLQTFIEKVTVFRHVTQYRDTEQGLNSGWKLATLYNKYTEYADILAAHGQLAVAQKYLDLLPSEFPAAEIARNRVKLATQKPAAAARPAAAATARSSSRVQPQVVGYQPPTPSVPSNQNNNPYASFGQPQNTPMQQQQGGYLPPQNQFQPTGYQPTGYQPSPQPGFTSAAGPPPMSGPPRNTTPSVPPPSQSKNMQNWNDVPLVPKAPPRRGTPSMAPITSPFPGSTSPSNMTGPPTGPPPPGHFNQRTGSTPPPPPKGPAPPRVQSPLSGPPSMVQGPPRPSSTVASQYAPPPPQAGAPPPQASPMVPPSASPYNAPPAGPPPSNRYAPTPSAQQQNPGPMASMAPPPSAPASQPPPSNLYAPPAQQQAPQGQYAPSPYAPQGGQVGSPAPGPPPMGRPGPPPGGAPAQTPPPPKAAAPPPKARHPAGDRSHIPAHAQNMVEILDGDMQRVAAKAPPAFAPQVKDTQKRLGLLFDHLNNEELLQPGTIDELVQLAQAIQNKDYAKAQQLQVSIQTNKTEECGNWMVSPRTGTRNPTIQSSLTVLLAGRNQAIDQHEQGNRLKVAILGSINGLDATETRPFRHGTEIKRPVPTLKRLVSA